jgi:hypothetical protein
LRELSGVNVVSDQRLGQMVDLLKIGKNANEIQLIRTLLSGSSYPKISDNQVYGFGLPY